MLEYTKAITKNQDSEACVVYDFSEKKLYNFNGYITDMNIQEYKDKKKKTIKQAKEKGYILQSWIEK